MLPEESLDESHELDLVTIFSSSNHDGEMEAMAIRSILDANGIAAVLVGPSTLPSLEFQVQVAEGDVDAAQEAIAEAQAAGPSAAVEGELASEQAIISGLQPLPEEQ